MEEYITLTPPPPLGKCGFTLAEVLITLAIIGVVAALTIPTVVRNYQRQRYYAGFMKAYSILNQVTSRSIADNGSLATWNIPTAENDNLESFINDYFKPYLKIQKECIGAANKECFPESYKTLDGGYTYLYKPNNHRYKYNLAGGISIAFSPTQPTAYGLLYILVDINGFQQPNKAGRDLFRFSLFTNPDSILPYALYSNYNEATKKREYMSIGSIKLYCKITPSEGSSSNNNGTNCGALLLREGKMNY